MNIISFKNKGIKEGLLVIAPTFLKLESWSLIVGFIPIISTK